MALTAQQQLDLRQYFARVNTDPCAFVKADLAAAIAATDTWITNNQASYVAALPAAFAAGSDAAQKSLLFVYVLMKREGLL